MNKIILSIATLATIAIQSCTAQIKNVKTENVKVYGNCGMCKKNIETAAYKKKVSTAVWDKGNKTALLTYDSTQTTAEAILKKIALAGYDNQNFLAPDDVYAKLDMCCQYERKKPTQQVSDTRNTTTTTTTPQDTAKTAVVKNPLSAVYIAYFALKDALTKDNGTNAAAKAKELFKAIDNVPMEKLTTIEHTIWMKYMKDLSYNAEHIKGTTRLEHQREHFVKLSATMIEVMKTIKPDYTVYIDHCPMYNDNKGADWLSTESGIKNPYYGSSMLTCGKTKETITK
jgi:hypothetical protein